MTCRREFEIILGTFRSSAIPYSFKNLTAFFRFIFLFIAL